MIPATDARVSDVPPALELAESGLSSDDILRAVRRLIQSGTAFANAMSRASGLTASEVMCLRAASELPSPQRTMNHLAHHALLSAPTASRILNRLVDAGLLMRERTQDDRRKVYLSLTEAGHAKLDACLQGMYERFERGFQAMAPDEQQTLLASLERAIELLDAGLPRDLVPAVEVEVEPDDTEPAL